jgi:2-polyprenyl-6-methoxyphenol hydroxylase-like FAD-dependent oxidoreductase
MTQSDLLHARCLIAGGGPAGLMLALLLARAGVQVTVLEKHADFLRDFRGDTVHPSTLEVVHELGLLDDFLLRPHDPVRELRAVIGNTEVTIADFSRLPTKCKFIALMPQWDFLDFLRDEAERFPGFKLITRAEVTSVIEEGGRITGVMATTPEGPLRVNADLVVGCDGRRSAVRASAGLKVNDIGAPIDVLWMRLPRVPGDPDTTGGRIDTGRFLAMLNRGDYWQCAYVIPKDGIQAIHERGLEAFRADLAGIAPLFRDRVGLLQTWDDIKLLSVKVDRLEQWWKPGLLCIGDAAHAMSPVGGIGINLAIQDAVAAGNILAGPLAEASVTAEGLTPFLRQVQERRLFPTRVTQSVQVAVQERILKPVLAGAGSSAPMAVPWPLKLMNRLPILRTIPAYAVGIGVRPEHVKSPLILRPAPVLPPH